MKRSRVAEELRVEDTAAMAAMPAQERLELAFALGRRTLEMYAEAHHLDRVTASKMLKRIARSGRPHSRCMDDEG